MLHRAHVMAAVSKSRYHTSSGGLRQAQFFAVITHHLYYDEPQIEAQESVNPMVRHEPATTTEQARRTFTLIAGHPHPDDESSGTGGLLRLAAAQGHTTVLVTCTNGDLGDVKDPRLRLQPRAHPADRQRLAAVRHAELQQAASILRVTHLYPLGYYD